MKKLELTKVRWKNFLSYGEQWTEIVLTKNDFTTIVGKNGQGKSCIFESVCFALYGKTLRKVPKSSLVNTRNEKGLLVELQFISNGKKYVVRRGIKPNKFEIYSGKELIAQDASVRDYQNKLEKIIGIDYNTFIQTVIISKTKYTPFMRLDAATRRAFVENLLTLTIFGNMYKSQKAVISELKSNIDDLKTRYEVLDNNINKTKEHIESIQDILNQNLNEKKSLYETNINNLKKENDTLKLKGKKLKDKLYDDGDNNSLSVYNKAVTSIDTLQSKINNQSSKLSDYKNGNYDYCSECGQSLPEDKLKDSILKLENKINGYKKELADNQATIKDLKPIVDKIEKNKELKLEIQNIVKTMKSNDKQIEKNKKYIDDLVIDDTKIIEETDKLNSYKKEYDELRVTLKDKIKDLKYNKIVYDMLKDDGIKSSIINKSIPLINNIINKNLSKFGFFVNFELDSEFNETIKQRGIDVLTYDSFSEGEKLRIDMAVLLAWREVAQIQNNVSCNVLFFDEMTDASLDFDGSDTLGSMLQELADTHVFVITHSPEKMQVYSDETLTVKKEDGYSTIVV